MAKSKRLAATKFPLNTFKSESRAAARIILTIQGEPTIGLHAGFTPLEEGVYRYVTLFLNQSDRYR